MVDHPLGLRPLPKHAPLATSRTSLAHVSRAAEPVDSAIRLSFCTFLLLQHLHRGDTLTSYLYYPFCF